MVELSVVEIIDGQGTKGLGSHVFVYPPRVGELIWLSGPAPGLDCYLVISVEHSPVHPESERSPLARQEPKAALFVKWSHDFD